MKFLLSYAQLFFALLLFALSTQQSFALNTTTPTQKRQLNKALLFSSSQLNKPLAMAELTPPNTINNNALSFNHTFSGRITLTAKPKLSSIAAIVGKITPDAQSMVRAILPTIRFDFVQHNNDIIPIQRSLMTSQHPYWDYIVGLGKIWQESDDGNYYRVAMPFSLIEKNQNCVHNGVLTFLLNAQGESSQFYYQISSETCLYFQADLWGMGDVSYQGKSLKIAEQVIRWFTQEKAARLPTKPLADIKQLTPNKNIKLSALSLKKEIPAYSISAYGIVSDGIHYVSECQTRAGAYPFCDEMVLPSYSTAKSWFAGIAMLRMATLYPNIFNEKISDWVPACKDNWQGVTFAHLLNMSTGHYLSTKSSVDESAEHGLKFFNSKSHQDKITYSCRQFPQQVSAGTQFVYHTSDTYLLGTALTNFLMAKQNTHTTKTADIFSDILVKDIWPAAKLSPVLYRSRRTLDKRKQAFSGYGLFYLRDDIAKFNHFLTQQLNLPEQKSLLDQTQLKHALQKLEHPSGIKTNYNGIRYSNGFWAKKISDILSCEQETWLPLMSGYGGISIVLLPNNRTFYYVSDSGKFTWKKAIIELNKIEPTRGAFKK